MTGFICTACHTWQTMESLVCPGCGVAIVAAGDGKNVIDRLVADCLIHRYEGSDMLEPAAVVKEGKTNLKVATKLMEYAKPVTVPKRKAYRFDPTLLGSIQALRNERTATINRYDLMIQQHWKNLQPYGLSLHLPVASLPPLPGNTHPFEPFEQVVEGHAEE